MPTATRTGSTKPRGCRTKRKAYYEAGKLRLGLKKKPRWHPAYIRKMYGMSVDQLQEEISNSDGLCAICRQHSDLVIDHDHQSNKYRGLLCRSCNLLLGFAHDEVEMLESAIRYLKERQL
jgi:hypothetical protein